MRKNDVNVPFWNAEWQDSQRTAINLRQARPTKQLRMRFVRLVPVFRAPPSTTDSLRLAILSEIVAVGDDGCHAGTVGLNMGVTACFTITTITGQGGPR